MDASQVESFDAETGALSLSLAAELYPKEVLYAAAYVFIDRAYLLLDRHNDRYLVHFRAKSTMPPLGLQALAGEFENELLAQALRLRVVAANQRLIEQVTALAIAGATANSAPAPAIVDDTVAFVDDPLGLAKPWRPPGADT